VAAKKKRKKKDAFLVSVLPLLNDYGADHLGKGREGGGRGGGEKKGEVNSLFLYSAGVARARLRRGEKGREKKLMLLKSFQFR